MDGRYELAQRPISLPFFLPFLLSLPKINRLSSMDENLEKVATFVINSITS
jgi:hypothetical protein